MNVIISPKKTAKMLMAGVVFLVVMHVLTQGIKFMTGHDEVFGLVPLFDLDRENNFPSVYSFLLLLMAGKVIGCFAYDAFTRRKKFAAVWATWSAIFTWFALDELLSFHEAWGNAMSVFFKTKGVFYYIWQAPYLLVLLFIIYFSIPLWKSLDQKFRRTSIMAAGIYLFATIVLECAGGWYFSLHSRDPIYVSLATMEETLEMCGVILFIYGLLEQARSQIGPVTISWAAPEKHQ